MLIAVTGATGFIGRNLLAYLNQTGLRARAVIRRPPTTTTALGAVPFVVAPLEPASLVRAFEGADVVVHLAGLVHGLHEADYHRVNVVGTQAVVEAAARVQARLVHISSLSVAGPATAASPSTEDDPPRPMTAYGNSKSQSEQIVQTASRLRWTILRPTIVYGPGDRALLPLFKWTARRIVPIVGRYDAAYTFVHVDDLSRAIVAAASGRSDGEIVFIGHPEIVTPRKLLASIEYVLHRKALTLHLPRSAASVAASLGEAIGQLVGRPMPINRSRFAELYASGFVCRVDRMLARLGIQPALDLEEGLAQTAAWYLREGWL